MLAPMLVMNEYMTYLVLGSAALGMPAAAVAGLGIALSLQNILNFSLTAVDMAFGPRLARALVHGHERRRCDLLLAIAALKSAAVLGGGGVVFALKDPDPRALRARVSRRRRRLRDPAPHAARGGALRSGCARPQRPRAAARAPRRVAGRRRRGSRSRPRSAAGSRGSTARRSARPRRSSPTRRPSPCSAGAAPATTRLPSPPRRRHCAACVRRARADDRVGRQARARRPGPRDRGGGSGLAPPSDPGRGTALRHLWPRPVGLDDARRHARPAPGGFLSRRDPPLRGAGAGTLRREPPKRVAGAGGGLQAPQLPAAQLVPHRTSRTCGPG